MTHPALHIYDAVDNLLQNLKLMSDRRPDAKIGEAASDFNAILKEAKKELPGEAMVQEMGELKDFDTVVALVSRLSVLKAELGATIYRPSTETRPYRLPGDYA